MKNRLKLCSLALLCALLLVSCGEAPVNETATTTAAVTTVSVAEESTTEALTSQFEITTTQEPEADAPRLNVVSNGKTSFKVVRSGNASDEIAVSSIQLRKKINDITGANVGLIIDQANPKSDGSMEILIGSTNRAASKEAKAALSGEAFGIQVTESGIVITATHEDFIPLAVDYFMENYLVNGELVQISEGYFSISTAASVICRGKLADLTNIRPDADYATISTHVGIVPREGNFRGLQGGCVTEKYAYMAVLNTTDYDTKDAGCYIYKLSTDNWRVVKRSSVLMLAHANDITYNPNNNMLYVAHCYVDATRISVIDADTLKLVNTIYTESGIYALDYHAPTNTFIGGQGKSGTIFFRFSNDGKRLITNGKITPTPTQMVTQGICRDDKYAYHVMYSTQSDEPYNTIIIYDLKTKKLASKVRLSISDQEPENISLVDGAFYIGCNPKGSTLDIYKSVLYEFDFDTCIAWQ